MTTIFKTIFCLAICSLLATAQSAAQLTVQGDIPAPMTLKASELAELPHQTVSATDHGGAKVSYDGVPLRDILKKAGIPFGKDLRGKALDSYIVAKAHDGYEVVFSLGELDSTFGNEMIFVADKREGKPLDAQQGPLRLVCSDDKAPARSVRMLETIEFVRLKK